MSNDRLFFVALTALGVVGLGLVCLAGLCIALSKEIPPALWSLLAAITGGILAAVPGIPGRSNRDDDRRSP